MVRKFGVFLFLAGILILFMSFAPGEVNKDSLTIFFSGVLLVFLGYSLWSRNRDRTPVERFRILRKFSSKKEDKEKTD